MENGIAVNVAVRVRPLLASEDTDVIKYMHGDPPVLCVSEKRNVYAFDQIFSSDIQQYEIYNVMLKPLVSRVLSGYNCIILAYGQTGTGKTYTMGSDSQRYHNDAGLIPRVLDDFFEVSTSDPDVSISISFIEIYNEKVYDLLRPSKTALAVKGFSVHGMTCVPIECSEDASHWLRIGGRGRHVRHTALNASSSRSHAVFTVYCTKTASAVTSKLHLVDLAGSESVRRTGNQGRAFQEGVTINRGLLAVGRVISALSDKRRRTVVPYRESTLTTILHDSLSANNYVSLLACVSPSESDISETLATLRFAVTAKSLKSKPQMETIVAEYDRRHPGVLNVVAPMTTVQKKRIRPPLFPSTAQPKRSRLATQRNILQPARTDSSIYSSTMDSLSVSTSTTIDSVQPQFNISPLVQRCAEALQESVLEQVTRVLRDHNTTIPAPPSKENENTAPDDVPWTSFNRQVTQIIRNELAQMTVTRANVEEHQKITSPIMKRQLRFDSLSPPLNDSNDETAPIIQPADEPLKVPVVRGAIKTVKATTRKSLAVLDAPVACRRSMRLSLKRPDVVAIAVPTPPLSVTAVTVDATPQTTKVPAVESRLRTTRRSVRLCMKRLTTQSYVHTPAPAPRFMMNLQNSTSVTLKPAPTPAPRKLIMLKSKTPSKVGTPKLSSALHIIDTPPNGLKVHFISPNKTKYTPRTQHREQVLRTLNRGSEKDLQRLSTVGEKSAMQIITFRTLNGEFPDIDALENIPAWKRKRFDRFIVANQL